VSKKEKRQKRKKGKKKKKRKKKQTRPADMIREESSSIRVFTRHVLTS
jgi:hypothetical protein